MPQSDGQVQNANFPAFRTDLNDNLAALFSQSSGASAPAVTQPFQPWIDTSTNPATWYIRNAANTGWITIGTIDATTFSTGGVTAIANGGTGQTTATAALTALLPSQAGNAGKALVTDGSLAGWGSSGFQATLATAVASTSGTSIDFTGIPSWAKRITVMLSGVSTNGTSGVLIQLGTSSGIENTGYTSSAYYDGGAGATSTAGFIIDSTTSVAAATRFGALQVALVASNAWVAGGVITGLNNASGRVSNSCAGGKTVAATLDRVRITTVGGTDTFDGGTINIMYEG